MLQINIILFVVQSSSECHLTGNWLFKRNVCKF